MTTYEQRTRALILGALRERGIEGMAETSFVNARDRFQIGLRARNLAGAEDVEVHSGDPNPRVLRVHVHLYWETWLCLGMWHLWTWYWAHRTIKPLVPRGVRLRVRPW